MVLVLESHRDKEKPPIVKITTTTKIRAIFLVLNVNPPLQEITTRKAIRTVNKRIGFFFNHITACHSKSNENSTVEKENSCGKSGKVVY